MLLLVGMKLVVWVVLSDVMIVFVCVLLLCSWIVRLKLCE